MNSKNLKLEALRQKLHQTESELRDLGYRTERSVAHPGSTASNQTFGEETLILVLSGSLQVECQDQILALGPGDHLNVPGGVPYVMKVLGETAAYWIQANRKEQGEDKSSAKDSS